MVNMVCVSSLIYIRQLFSPLFHLSPGVHCVHLSLLLVLVPLSLLRLLLLGVGGVQLQVNECIPTVYLQSISQFVDSLSSHRNTSSLSIEGNSFLCSTLLLGSISSPWSRKITISLGFTWLLAAMYLWSSRVPLMRMLPSWLLRMYFRMLWWLHTFMGNNLMFSSLSYLQKYIHASLLQLRGHLRQLLLRNAEDLVQMFSVQEVFEPEELDVEVRAVHEQVLPRRLFCLCGDSQLSPIECLVQVQKVLLLVLLEVIPPELYIFPVEEVILEQRFCYQPRDLDVPVFDGGDVRVVPPLDVLLRRNQPQEAQLGDVISPEGVHVGNELLEDLDVSRANELSHCLKQYKNHHSSYSYAISYEDIWAPPRGGINGGGAGWPEGSLTENSKLKGEFLAFSKSVSVKYFRSESAMFLQTEQFFLC